MKAVRWLFGGVVLSGDLRSHLPCLAIHTASLTTPRTQNLQPETVTTRLRTRTTRKRERYLRLETWEDTTQLCLRSSPVWGWQAQPPYGFPPRLMPPAHIMGVGTLRLLWGVGYLVQEEVDWDVLLFVAAAGIRYRPMLSMDG